MLRKEQTGFRKGRSCGEHIFTLRQVLEQCQEWKTPCYVNFIDFEKDFDSIHRPLSRRLDRCDRVIQNESRDSFGGNVYYVIMQITFLTRKFRNRERNLHCDVVHITTKWVSSLTLDCNGVFVIKVYRESLWCILRHYGIPCKIVTIITMLYEGFKSKVIYVAKT